MGNGGYIYNIDKDRGLLTVTQWDCGKDWKRPRQLRGTALKKLEDPSLLMIEKILEVVDAPISEELSINTREPTPLNELQLLMLTDFIFTWREYF